MTTSPSVPSWQHILVEDKAATRVITINRPDVRNALSSTLIDELSSALQQAAEARTVRTIVLTGVGKAFCAGLDLAELKTISQRSTEENRHDSAKIARLLEHIYHNPKPVIAAVNGHAVAGGAGIASACDFVLMAENAKFGYSESRIGFVAAIVAVYLIRQVGERQARDLLLSARLISAQEAHSMGLVNAVYPAEEVLGQALELAQQLQQNAPSSLRLSKTLLANLYGMGFSESIHYASEMNALARSTDELKEGVSAFLEKRAPDWQNNQIREE